MTPTKKSKVQKDDRYSYLPKTEHKSNHFFRIETEVLLSFGKTKEQPKEPNHSNPYLTWASARLQIGASGICNDRESEREDQPGSEASQRVP